MKCTKHPRYQGKRKPRTLCESCWEVWFYTRYGMARVITPLTCHPSDASSPYDLNNAPGFRH